MKRRILLDRQVGWAPPAACVTSYGRSSIRPRGGWPRWWRSRCGRRSSRCGTPPTTRKPWSKSWWASGPNPRTPWLTRSSGSGTRYSAFFNRHRKNGRPHVLRLRRATPWFRGCFPRRPPGGTATPRTGSSRGKRRTSTPCGAPGSRETRGPPGATATWGYPWSFPPGCATWKTRWWRGTAWTSRPATSSRSTAASRTSDIPSKKKRLDRWSDSRVQKVALQVPDQGLSPDPPPGLGRRRLQQRGPLDAPEDGPLGGEQVAGGAPQRSRPRRRRLGKWWVPFFGPSSTVGA